MSEKNVYQRIHAVANEIGTIEKNGRNNFHKYDYATEADFVHALRPLLNKHGLVIIPSVASIPQTDPQESGLLTNITMKFTIVNIDKPDDKVDMLIPGQGQDKGDKGVYKALTGAKKYFIALAFMVATGDDPESDGKTKPTSKTVETTFRNGITPLAEKIALEANAATANAVAGQNANQGYAAGPAAVPTKRTTFRKNVTVNATANSTGDDI